MIVNILKPRNSDAEKVRYLQNQFGTKIILKRLRLSIYVAGQLVSNKMHSSTPVNSSNKHINEHTGGNKMSKKPKTEMWHRKTKSLNQVKWRELKGGKDKKTLMEKQTIAFLSKKVLQTRELISRQAKQPNNANCQACCAQCHSAGPQDRHSSRIRKTWARPLCPFCNNSEPTWLSSLAGCSDQDLSSIQQLLF